MKKKTAIYCRTNDAVKSIDDQVRDCKTYASKMGLRVQSKLVFTDVAASGISRDRIGLERLLEEARSGNIDTVITEDLSRISRNTLQALNVIQELDFLGVRLISVSDNIDTDNKSLSTPPRAAEECS